MNRNCIIVLNYNNVWCDNARNSIQFAANKWGCEVLEVKHLSQPHLFPTWSRPECILMGRHFDRVLFLDADVLVRSDAPSIFEIYNELDFYCVKDLPDNCTKEYEIMVKEDVQAPFFGLLNEQFKGALSESDYYSGFFNGGVLLLNVRKCIKALNLFIKNIPTKEMLIKNNYLCQTRYSSDRIDHPKYGSSHHEQALFNYCIRTTLKDRVGYMKRTWNQTQPNIEIGVMDSYIYHFCGEHKHVLGEVLKTFYWDV